jgi:hypothetical protein
MDKDCKNKALKSKMVDDEKKEKVSALRKRK